MADKFCMHCGRKIKDTDRFCIFCGKPVLSTSKISNNKKQSPSSAVNSSDSKDVPNTFKSDILMDKKSGDKKGAGKGSEEGTEKEEEAVPFVSGGLAPPEESDGDEDSKKSKKDKKADKKGNKKGDKKPFIEDEFEADDFDMDESLKTQFENKIELALLARKKEKLKGILKDILNESKTEKYKFDIDFAKEVNVKLDAAKQVLEEIQQKEDEIKDSIGIFKLDELDHVINERRMQLTELKRKYKLKKIQENIFRQLQSEYSSDFKEAQEEKEEIMRQLNIWISRLKTEQNKLEIKKNMVSGRYKTKEISKEQYEEEIDGINKEIDSIKVKIEVLRDFTINKKSLL